MRAAGRLAVLGLALLASCQQADSEADRPADARGFPRAMRVVSPPEAGDGASESERDRMGEASAMMTLADIRSGMTVADIGAGEGYYTVRLARRVGARGRVLAEDIDRATVNHLGERVAREALDNVSITLGDIADPHLPPASFDRVFLVHMYHEVAEPYAFLWHLRPALRAGGTVVVMEGDRAGSTHGIPPATLMCEFSALGFRLTNFVRKPEFVGYYAQFEAVGPRPSPEAVKPCQVSAPHTAAARANRQVAAGRKRRVREGLVA